MDIRSKKYWLIKVDKNDYLKNINKQDINYNVIITKNNDIKKDDIVITYVYRYINNKSVLTSIFEVDKINKIDLSNYNIIIKNVKYMNLEIKNIINIINTKYNTSYSIYNFNGKYLKNGNNILQILEDTIGKYISNDCFQYNLNVKELLDIIYEDKDETETEDKNKNNSKITLSNSSNSSKSSKSSNSSNSISLSNFDSNSDNSDNSDSDNSDSDNSDSDNSDSDNDNIENKDDSNNNNINFRDTKKLSGNLIPILMIPCELYNKEDNAKKYLEHFNDCVDCQQINNNILDLRYILLKYNYKTEYKEVEFKQLKKEYDNFSNLEAYIWNKIPKQTTIKINYIKDTSKYNKCIILIIYIVR